MPDQTAPALAYAIIRDQEGEISAPDPRDIYRIDSLDGELTDAQAHRAARDVADSRNTRDAEASDVWRWRVVALVPITP